MKKDRKHNDQKKDKQHNDQKKRDRRPNNNLQNTTQKTKDRAMRTLQKPVVNSDTLEG